MIAYQGRPKGGVPARHIGERTRTTLEEQGMSAFDTGLWFGLIGPAEKDKLGAVALKALETPQAQEATRKQSFESLNEGPDQFADYIRRETVRWTAVRKTPDCGAKAGPVTRLSPTL
jgi:tripartite-type tricarboxylate transporter receptor subunit TctC